MEETIDTTQSTSKANKAEDTSNNVNQSGIRPTRQKSKVMDVNLLKRVDVRTRDRVRQIQKDSQAKHEKVMIGNQIKWQTTPPKMHISNLQVSITKDEGVITYAVYKTDKKGGKVGEIRYREVEKTVDGKIETQKIPVDQEYEIDREVVERIRYRQPIQVEEYEVGR